jgi:hypothetical protein
MKNIFSAVMQWWLARRVAERMRRPLPTMAKVATEVERLFGCVSPGFSRDDSPPPSTRREYRDALASLRAAGIEPDPLMLALDPNRKTGDA